jgi:hypothetical protein
MIASQLYSASFSINNLYPAVSAKLRFIIGNMVSRIQLTKGQRKPVIFLLSLVLFVMLFFVLTGMSSFTTSNQKNPGRRTKPSISFNQTATFSKYPSRTQTRVPQPTVSVKVQQQKLENAAIVFLARNKEVYGILSSMQNIEDRFNRGKGYPYIFLNDEPFSQEFKE